MAQKKAKEEMEELNRKIDRILNEQAEGRNEQAEGRKEMAEGRKETAEGIKHLQATVGKLTETVQENKDAITAVVADVTRMKDDNSEKDNIIESLQKQVDSMEQVARMNDVIITGCKIRPRTYAGAVAANGDEDGQQPTSTEEQIAEYLESMGIEFDVNNIESCYSLSRKANIETPAVLIKFVNRKDKMDLLKQGRKLKGTTVFINEHLTKQNADIAKKARIARKNGKIQRTWTANCKIFIKLNGSPEEAKVVWVRNIEELDKYQ